MTRFIKRIKRVGIPPGTIVETEQAQTTAHITLFDYDAGQYQEKKIVNVEDCFSFKQTSSVTWINIEGVDPKTIMALNTHFDIHALVSEDIINTGQRPKMVDYEGYIFIVLRMMYFSEERDEIRDEQISIVLGENYVISFQEMQGDVFDVIRTRIREAKGRIRAMGADYLAYCLLDAIVDGYFLILEDSSDDIEQLEDDIMQNLDDGFALAIHQYKRDMIYLRKQIWPLRELINGLQKSESPLIKKTTVVYLRDVYDHVIHIIDTVDSFRDVLSGLHDIYLSTISNKMNEVMKILTIFAAIFIPLTFLVGIYGMNFDNMPELRYKHGYFIFLGFLALVAFTMILFFKRRKWL